MRVHRRRSPLRPDPITTPPRLRRENVGPDAAQCVRWSGCGGAEASSCPSLCAGYGVGVVHSVSHARSERTGGSAHADGGQAGVGLSGCPTFGRSRRAPGTCTRYLVETPRFAALHATARVLVGTRDEMREALPRPERTPSYAPVPPQRWGLYLGATQSSSHADTARVDGRVQHRESASHAS
jgi:hypothetical protein